MNVTLFDSIVTDDETKLYHASRDEVRIVSPYPDECGCVTTDATLVAKPKPKRKISKPRAPKTPSSVILWEGPSRIDGQPIVAIATNITTKSANSKTGAMVQTFILRQDIHPWEAIQTGADHSICGNCQHRLDPVTGKRVCYVVPNSFMSVWNAYKRGSYRFATPDELRSLFAGKAVRLGAYGDPAAVPLDVWQAVVSEAATWTGYTHQWRDAGNADYRHLLMASCELAMDVRAADRRGWRAFWVESPDGDPTLDGTEVPAMRCPASKERQAVNRDGVPVQCVTCGACAGTSSRNKRHIIILQH